MPGDTLDLDAALDLTRTGDIWVFRGSSAADRAIRLTTNSPVNHVGMSVVLDDLPPLMWHAELGRSLPDMWTGHHQRGVQLHQLRDAVTVWAHRYGQRPWLRQLDAPVTPAMEEALLRAIARLDGTPFPSTTRMASRWFTGRLPGRPGDPSRRGRRGRRFTSRGGSTTGPATPTGAAGSPGSAGDTDHAANTGSAEDTARVETAYCAEVVALTYQMMGLLPPSRRPNWYDPGRFWSGDELDLAPGFHLGGEITVRVPPPTPRR